MDVNEWSQRRLVQSGAAHICDRHGYITASENVAAVKEAIKFAREIPFEKLSKDAAELAILETYLSLPETCLGCDQEDNSPPSPNGL